MRYSSAKRKRREDEGDARTCMALYTSFGALRYLESVQASSAFVT